MCRPSWHPSRCGSLGACTVAVGLTAWSGCFARIFQGNSPRPGRTPQQQGWLPSPPLPPPLQALSELQKENSGLRAACVTLGRELLSLKSEFTAFQQQTLTALAAINPNAAAMLLNPSPAASPMEVPMAAAPAAAAGEAAAAAGASAEQLQGYQAAAADAQHQQQFAATALSAGGTPTAAEAEAAAAAAAAAAAPTPLPAHMPAAAAPAAASAAAAAAAPQRELPRGDIVLVGGHDSSSWLDSVGEQAAVGARLVGMCLQR